MEPRFDPDALAARLSGAPSAIEAARAVAEELAAGADAVVRVHLRHGDGSCTVSTGGAWSVADEAPSAPRATADRTIVALAADGDADLGTLEAAGPDRPAAPALEAAAALLGRRLGELGTAGTLPAPHRLTAHLATLAALADAEAIERALLDAARELTAMASALLLRVDPLGRATPHRAAGPLAAALHAAPAETLTVVETLAGVRCAAPHLDPRLRASGARSFAAVPLRAHGRTEAILLLADSAERALEPADLEPLELLAAHAAVCLRAAAVAAALSGRGERDPLTGLGHHGAFHDALGRRRADGDELAIVLADVDGFAALNAARGHLAGDRVLREVASALAGVLRRGDELFRFDGDQFAALISVNESIEAADIGARLAAAVAGATTVTVSVGVSIPGEAESDDAIVERARQALAAARSAG